MSLARQTPPEARSSRVKGFERQFWRVKSKELLVPLDIRVDRVSDPAMVRLDRWSRPVD